MAEKEPPNEPAPDPSREAEARKVVQDYIDQLREMIKRLRRKLH